jgi:Ca-activated chloride channel family protein
VVGVVAYGSRAFVVIEPTPASREREIMEAINSLQPGGSTNAEAGLMIGYEMASRQFVNGHSNRIVLCSDGVANVGRTSPDQIMQQVKRYAIKGITLSSFGFGMGNYNDELLEQLSQRGNGRYAYVNDLNEARRQFVDDFAGNMQVLARDVKIQVEFDPRSIKSYRLLGYENRDVADHRFRDNQQDGGEVGAGHEVTAVYELISRGRGHSGKVATIFVRWKNDDETEITEVNREVLFNKKSGRFQSARPEFRLAIVAGQFAELLKGTELVESGYESLLAIAEPLLRELPGEQTRELVDLIRRARNLSTHYTDLRLERQSDDNYSDYRK